MPRLEIEIDDKGDFVGQTPAELEAILKRIEAEHYKSGYGKGVEQSASKAKQQIEDGIKHEMAKREAMEPLEKERVARVMSENEGLSSKVAEMARESDRLLKSREESHARELIDRTEKIARRDARIKDLTKTSIRTDAQRAGARDESLDELEVILSHYIGFDDEMQPFVKNPDGTAQLQHGKPVAVSAFVQQYVESHPHHRRPANPRGGDPRRGASLSHSGSGGTTVDAARNRIEKDNDRSAGAINDLFNATRKAGTAA